MPVLSFTLNGQKATAAYEPGMCFLEVLREECGILSPKDGCAPQGACGCCTIFVDGQPVLACLRKPEQMEGRTVFTLEGIPEEARLLLARAFVREGAVQYGFCIPGIVIRSYALLKQGRARDRQAIRKELAAHLCRCTGYNRIVYAIQTAGEAWENDGMLPRAGPRHADFFGEQFGRSRASAFHRGNGDAGVGTSCERYRGGELALGSKPFVADLQVEGILHAAPVFSAHPRARVLQIDPTPALAMPGVVRALTFSDVPGSRHVGLIVSDWPVFVATGEITRCIGDMLALVVADTTFHARRAAEQIVVEYEILQPVTDPFAALEPGAPTVHDSGNLLEVCAFSRGDVDAALAASAHVLEETFVTQRVEHAFLEPEVAKAREYGCATVAAASTGNAATALAAIAAASGIRAVVFVPSSAPEAKLVQMLSYGALVLPLEGTYDDAFELCLAACREFGWYNRNTALNPFTIEGKKTVALEIAADLAPECPDVVLVPTGDGVMISASPRALRIWRAPACSGLPRGPLRVHGRSR